ncbi:alpha/beta hydrolase [Sphingomonas sp. RP10(2022)]|uniref:Alpha/beta hydrolase n=1 Tax=Sphingomonas liriopis TaxID=2949094 RepID=A0A9X2HVE1_9SPHN|nr:alpha/beta hydrolase fold domain-containing protein [Sphingomonas liriopis]MCP3734314.1 alpha/beta hydrolase [Sphingomonas liriopis]
MIRLALAALALAPAAQVAAPWSDTLSREALAGLAADAARPPAPADMAARRARAEAIQRDIGTRQAARYRVVMADRTIGGVAVRVFTPAGRPRSDAVLLNLHGGGFVVDSGSLTENIPIAALTGMTVVAVRYRLAPEHLFPAPVEDATAVYRALLADRPQRRIGVYGTSAGAIVAAELVARLRAEKRTAPAALGFLSGSADLTRTGDTMALLLGADAGKGVARLYAGARDPADPAISPARGSLSGWPPTLCLSSTRDYLLSATADFCRALGDADADARLVVFDGLPHAFWSYIEAPESDVAFATMARFLRRHLETTR